MRSALASLACALCVRAFVQCDDEPTLYGSPDSMNGRAPAPPPGGYVVPAIQQTTCDAGAIGQENGDAGADAGCGVSFAKNIYEGSFKRMRCTDVTCHGVTPPVIAAVSASQARAALIGHVLEAERATSNRRYVEPCAKSPAASSIVCNLQVDGGCEPRMPLAPASPASEAELDQIRAWLACGAPDN